jgi:S1-C subfamily serine protease
VLIQGVLQGGPASQAGVQPGDVVLQVAGRPVANTSQLLNAVAALKPATAATLAIQRQGKPVDIAVKVAQRPKARAQSRDEE